MIPTSAARAIPVAIALLLLLTGLASSTRAAEPPLVARQLRVPTPRGEREVTLRVAEGLEIGLFAAGLPSARLLAESPSGELVLSLQREGRVVKLTDRDGDGVADEVVPILSGLSVPHGLAFAGETLFVAETHRVLRLDVWWDGASAREIISLPGYAHHQTRTLAVGPDGLLYVSVGSSCDVCVEGDPRRAAVWRFNLDGSGGEPYASGLRNAVGLAWQPGADRLWVTDNERNELGPDEPPDELNVLRPGGDYGWPACFGQRVPMPGFGSPERCAPTEPPAVELPAHSAPLGLAFYDGPSVPSEYRGDLLVALHGPARRTRPFGYSLVRVPFRDGQPQPPQELVDGWWVDGEFWGKPVAPFVARDGSLYLTDDHAGLVYRLRPTALGA